MTSVKKVNKNKNDGKEDEETFLTIEESSSISVSSSATPEDKLADLKKAIANLGYKVVEEENGDIRILE
jgi:anti-sigma28 factor (negative regulator of flagellin synthesis)